MVEYKGRIWIQFPDHKCLRCAGLKKPCYQWGWSRRCLRCSRDSKGCLDLKNESALRTAWEKGRICERCSKDGSICVTSCPKMRSCDNCRDRKIKCVWPDVVVGLTIAETSLTCTSPSASDGKVTETLRERGSQLMKGMESLSLETNCKASLEGCRASEPEPIVLDKMGSSSNITVEGIAPAKGEEDGEITKIRAKHNKADTEWKRRTLASSAWTAVRGRVCQRCQNSRKVESKDKHVSEICLFLPETVKTRQRTGRAREFKKLCRTCFAAGRACILVINDQ